MPVSRIPQWIFFLSIDCLGHNLRVMSSHFLQCFFYLFCSTTLEPYDSDAMAREFLAQFHHHSFTVGQTLVFSFQDKKMLAVVVKDLEGTLFAPIQTLLTH